MRCITRVCSFLAGFLLLAAAAFSQQSAPSPTPVGRYGHPAKLIVRGTEKIPAQVVKQRLLADPEVLLAGHPFAPLDDYPKTLQRRAIDGYQFEGFPDARVTAALDKQSGQIVVTVEEGRRFSCGEIRIEGAEQIDTEKLIQRLTLPFVPSGAIPVAFNDDGSLRRWSRSGVKIVGAGPSTGPSTSTLSPPVWKRGGPAPFGKPSGAAIHRKVREAFADLGYAAADFSVHVEPDRAAGTADLRIAIADEGPPSRVGAIEVAGCARNSRDAVIEYLGLKPGQRYTPAVRATLAYKLWKSGRFLTFRVTQEPDGESGAVNLKIELVEYPHAPPLDAEFNQYEKILLRCRDWLAHLEDSDYDLVILNRGDVGDEGQPLEIEFGLVISGRSGAILTGGVSRERDPQRPAALPPYALVVSEELLAVYSTPRGAKLVAPPPKGFLDVQFSFGLGNEPDDERPNRLGFEFYQGTKSRKPPLDFGIRYDPVAFVGLAHIEQPRFEIQRGVLTLRTDHGEARIEVETGRLIEYSMRDPEYNQYARLTTEKGAFARRLNELERATDTFDNKFDADRPATSLASFILDDQLLFEIAKEFTRSNKKNGQKELDHFGRLISVGRKLVSGDALAPLDRWLTEPDAKTEGAFRIPLGIPPQGTGPAPAFWFPVAMGVADGFFPRETWAWTISRETALVVSGRGKYTGQVLQQIYESPQTGPLCQLVVAALLDSRGIPLAQRFAARGLERLAVVDFQNDYRPLLNREYVVGACVLKAAELVRQFSDEEAKTVGHALLGENARYFVQCVRTLRERRDEPVEDVLPEALDGLWEGGLSPQVSAALQDIQRR